MGAIEALDSELWVQSYVIFGMFKDNQLQQLKVKGAIFPYECVILRGNGSSGANGTQGIR